MIKNNKGFTLVEMMLVILVSAIVMFTTTAAAMNIVNLERASKETASTQMDARMLNMWLEELIKDDQIRRVELRGADRGIVELIGEDGNPIIVYLSSENAIVNANGDVILDRVLSFDASVDTTTGKSLLTVTMTLTPAGGASGQPQTYTMSAFNRAGQIKVVNEPTPTLQEAAYKLQNVAPVIQEPTESKQVANQNKATFLALLLTQLESDGRIRLSQDEYSISFAEWYSRGEWGADTPWCACFLSWAAEVSSVLKNPTTNESIFASAPPIFASCNDGVVQFREKGMLKGRSEGPEMGDYVFFDFNKKTDGSDHVGMVLFVDEASRTFTTIEGNSNNKVTTHVYSFDDTDIVAYGVVDWNSNLPTTAQ